MFLSALFIDLKSSIKKKIQAYLVYIRRHCTIFVNIPTLINLWTTKNRINNSFIFRIIS